MMYPSKHPNSNWTSNCVQLNPLTDDVAVWMRQAGEDAADDEKRN